MSTKKTKATALKKPKTKAKATALKKPKTKAKAATPKKPKTKAKAATPKAIPASMATPPTVRARAPVGGHADPVVLATPPGPPTVRARAPAGGHADSVVPPGPPTVRARAPTGGHADPVVPAVPVGGSGRVAMAERPPAPAVAGLGWPVLTPDCRERLRPGQEVEVCVYARLKVGEDGKLHEDLDETMEEARETLENILPSGEKAHALVRLPEGVRAFEV